MSIDEVLIYGAFLVVIVVLAILRGRTIGDRADRNVDRKRAKARELPDDSALDSPIDCDTLRGSPDELDKLAAKVSSVHVMRVPGHDGSDDHYEGYVVDINGLPAGFALDTDRAVVLRQASWLAEQLELSLSDDT
ncbi:MAG: hypothetical protein ACLFVJ_15235 [Persicimonas sp.]